jgi:hypothetical protein
MRASEDDRDGNTSGVLQEAANLNVTFLKVAAMMAGLKTKGVSEVGVHIGASSSEQNNKNRKKPADRVPPTTAPPTIHALVGTWGQVRFITRPKSDKAVRRIRGSLSSIG